MQNKNRDVILPEVEKRTIGPRVQERLLNIMTGRETDLYGWTKASKSALRPNIREIPMHFVLCMTSLITLRRSEHHFGPKIMLTYERGTQPGTS